MYPFGWSRVLTVRYSESGPVVSTGSTVVPHFGRGLDPLVASDMLLTSAQGDIGCPAPGFFCCLAQFIREDSPASLPPLLFFLCFLPFSSGSRHSVLVPASSYISCRCLPLPGDRQGNEKLLTLVPTLLNVTVRGQAELSPACKTRPEWLSSKEEAGGRQ